MSFNCNLYYIISICPSLTWAFIIFFYVNGAGDVSAAPFQLKKKMMCRLKSLDFNHCGGHKNKNTSFFLFKIYFDPKHLKNLIKSTYNL